MGSDGAGLPGGELLAGLLRAAGSSLVGMEVAAAAGNGFGLGLLTQQVQIPLATAWRLMTARVAAGAGAGGWSYYLNLDPAVGQPGVVNAPLTALQGRQLAGSSPSNQNHIPAVLPRPFLQLLQIVAWKMSMAPRPAGRTGCSSAPTATTGQHERWGAGGGQPLARPAAAAAGRGVCG